MKGCLILNGASPRSSPRPPARKCVSFCGSGSNSSSSSDDEQEIVEVHVADDWDRTPCEVTPKLTYQDLLELHELKNSMAYPHKPRTPQLLKRVPVGLLPLLSDASPPPSNPPPPSCNGVPKTNSTPIDNTPSPSQPPFLRKSHPAAPTKATSALARKFAFLPLMPVEDQSTGGMAQSPINPQSPVPPKSRLEGRFRFLPLLPTDAPASSSEPSSDDDHASPTSTPSLTASSSLPSPPGTPSATSSPSLSSSSMPPESGSDPDFSYFNLNRPSTGANRMRDQLNMTDVDSNFPKLRLEAHQSPNLIAPSPLELGGDKTGSKGEAAEKLDNSRPLGRKGGKRRVVEYININGVDEPFYSYVDEDEAEPPSCA